MNTSKILAAARKHLGGAMETSARECLEQAVRAEERSDYDAARRWALKSLAYSVGMFSPVYKEAAK